MKKIVDRIRQNEDFKELTSSSIRDFLNGNVLKMNVVRRQGWVFLLIIIMLFIYINNRYESEKTLSYISELKKEIQDAKYESLTISAELTEISRQSNIMQLLKTKGMQLKPGNEPPIVIE
jgi:predicted cation transporter